MLCLGPHLWNEHNSTKMPQVYVGRFFEPASFSTGFHGKLSSSSANSAHFGKTNKLRENQENLDNSSFLCTKSRGCGVWGEKAAGPAGEAGKKQKSMFGAAIPAWHMFNPQIKHSAKITQSYSLLNGEGQLNSPDTERTILM